MKWWQFSLNCQASDLELVEGLMYSLGACSISLADAGDEPIYEPLPGDTPVWQESILSATFDGNLDPRQIRQQLSNALPVHLARSLTSTTLQDQDWDKAYRRHFNPIKFGSDLWIVPSWLTPPDPAARIIELDPGLAFGTGSHPTTALCLTWMATHEMADCTVIDYGCGSGILAIAAIKLGARHVNAVDIDPQALMASESNMLTNNIDSDRIQLDLPEDFSSPPVDLLIANILAGPLVSLASELAQLVKPGGKILLSGILKPQLKEIQSAYMPYFHLNPASQREDWVCISGLRSGPETHG